MAGRHRSGHESPSTRNKSGKYHTQTRQREPYRWLGAGALTLGIGASLIAGSGLAHADDEGGSDTKASAPRATAPDRGTTTHTPKSKQPHDSDTDAPKAKPPIAPKRAHRESTTPAAKPSSTNVADHAPASLRPTAAATSSQPDTPAASTVRTTVQPESVTSPVAATPAVAEKLTQSTTSVMVAASQTVATSSAAAANGLATLLANTTSGPNPLPLLAFAGYRAADSRSATTTTGTPTAAAPVAGAAPPANSAAPTHVVGVVAVPGDIITSVQTADGSRSVFMTSSSEGLGSPTTYFVNVVNTATGAQVGNSFSTTLPPATMSDLGSAPSVRLAGEGQRAFVSIPQGTSTMLTLIDTGNGSVVSTNVIAGKTLWNVQSVGNGRVAMLTTSTSTGWTLGSPVASYVSFIDTVTGQTLGSSTAFTGTIQVPQFSSDGSRVVIVAKQNTNGSFTSATYSGTVAIFDTATGQQVGSGFQGTNLDIVVAGSDAVVTTYQATGSTSPNTGFGLPRAIYNPQISFLNLTTGQQTGDTMSYQSGSLTTDVTTRLSADGRWATVTSVFHSATPNPNPTSPTNAYTWQSTTFFETFNTTTGAQVGQILIAPNSAAKSTLLSSNGHYALVTAEADTDQSATTTFIDTHTGNTINSYAGTVAVSDGSHAVVIYTDQGASRATILDFAGGQRLSYNQIPGTSASAQMSSDGARTLVTTSGSGIGHATVFDLTSGQQLCTTDYAGSASLQATRDLTRAIVATPSADNSTVHATVINLLDGRQLSDIALAGTQYPQILRNTGDTRAILIDATHTFVVDLGTGRQLSSIDAAGSVQLNADGTRAIIAGTHYDAGTGQVANSTVVVVNLITGKQLNAYEEPGSGFTSTQFAPHGDRAVVVTGSTDNATGVSTTKVTVINTATGQKVNSTSIDQAAAQFMGVDFTPDGTRALIRTQTHNADTNVDASQITVIDTSKQDSGAINNSSGNPLAKLFNQLGAQITHVVNQVRAQITAFVTKVVNTITGSPQGGSSSPGPEFDVKRAWDDFSLAVGWIPIVGTFVNGINLVLDTNDLFTALGKGDTDAALDDVGRLTGDVAGMVPVVGPAVKALVKVVRKPLAELVHVAGDAVQEIIGVAVGGLVTGVGNAVKDTVTAAVGFVQDTFVNIGNGLNRLLNWGH